MSRVMRGTGALAVLLAGLIGLPAALAVLGGNPLPSSLSWAAMGRALLTPDDGSILLGLVTVVGWLAWLVFAASVVSEAITLISRSRIRIQLPGFGGPQRVAAGLLISVLAMLSVPQVAHAPAPTVAPVVAAAPLAQARPVAPTPPVAEPKAETSDAASLAGSSGVRPLTHEVTAGDDLWSLAEHYYGRGRDWRKIAAANPKVLTGGPDRLEPGWRLVIPDPARPGQASTHHSVVVRRGDTLSSLAERELGAAQRWTEIFRLNRAQLDNPDELAVGLHLTLPTPRAAEEDRVSAQSPVGDPEPAPRARPTAPATPHAPAPASASPSPSARVEPTGPAAASPEARATPPVSDAEVPRPQVAETPPAVDAGSALAMAGVGGLLAAGLLGGLAVRRRIQLQLRPVGRRIAHPSAPAQTAEVALGRRQRPLSLRTLDRAMRAVAAHCRTTGAALPPILYALVADHEIELVFSQPWPDPPVGFTARGRSWLLDQADAGYLTSVPGLSESDRPWPTLVTLGHDDRDRQVLGDLEAMGLLQLRSEHPAAAEALLAALAVELSFSPWADEMFLTLVGSCDGLPAALGRHNVARTSDLDGLLERLAQRAQSQRDHQPSAVLGQHRLDPDLADPWAAEIVLLNVAMSAQQRAKLEAIVRAEPRVTIAAVVTDPAFSAPWSLHLPGAGDQSLGLLEPAGLRLRPQQLDPPAVGSVIELVQTTGSELTTAAPWWADPAEPPDPPPDNVAFLQRRGAGWGSTDTEGREAVVRTVMANPDHPTLQLLGPVELRGAAGDPPPRAGKQCLEYCAWLLENPGTTAQAMAAALVVAEGTRRSNMSRLRGWLGADSSGQPYLPDAYTGRIRLHPTVSSDWHQLKLVTGPGVNRAGVESLRTALGLVRGAPLADAAPGQWHWAEELRTDMISCLRDIGVELATRALEQGDIDLARWAAARALVAAPGDELLMVARIRTEHLAGNAPETERLTLQLTTQARSLGVDLDDETVVLLQQVMEGRVRARMA